MSSTQPGQDDPFVLGGYITSGVSVYQVESFLGRGTYGKVVKCTRMDDQKTVAIKIMKLEPCVSYEVEALRKIKSLDPEECSLVQWHSFFIDKGNIYLEFEHLDKSLFDYIWGRQTHHLYLKEIRPIVQQLASALCHLKTIGIVHADLKLENVMLVDQLKEPYRVKIIDFGLAFEVSSAKVGSCIQSCAYRSPEIILGLPFTEAVDMWSLGCVTAAMYLSTLLYPGRCEYEVMRYMVEILGQPPDSMLSNGQKTSLYFEKHLDSTETLWRLKTPEKVQGEMGIEPKDMRELVLTSLEDIQHVWGFKSEGSEDKVVEAADRLAFVDMLKAMFQLEPAKRMTPTEVVDHDFISMRHFAGMYKRNTHVSSCFQLMDTCVNMNSTSDKYRTSNKSSLSSRCERLDQRNRAVLDVGSRTARADRVCTARSNVSRMSAESYNEDVGSSKRTSVPLKTDRTVKENSADLPSLNDSVSTRMACCHISDSKYNDGKRSSSKYSSLTPTCSQSAVNKSQVQDYNWKSSTEKQNNGSSASSSISTVKSHLKIRPNHSQILDFNSDSSAHSGIRANKWSPDSSILKHRVGSQGAVSTVINGLDSGENSNSNYRLPFNANCSKFPVFSRGKERMDDYQISDSKYNLSANYEIRKSERSAVPSTSKRITQSGGSVLVNTKLDGCQVGGSDHKQPSYKENEPTQFQKSWKQSCMSSNSKTRLVNVQDSSFCLANEGEYLSECSEGSCVPTFQIQTESCVLSKLDHYLIPSYKNASGHMDKNNRKSPLGLSTVPGRRRDQICVSSEVRRRLDHLKKSDHSLNNNHTGAGKCCALSSPSNCRSQTKCCFSCEVNRRLDQSQISDSGHNPSTHDKKKVGKSSSASSSLNWTNGKSPSNASAEAERRTDHCKIPDCAYSMSHHNEQARECFTSSHSSSCRNLTQSCVSSEIKRELLQKYLHLKLQEPETEVSKHGD